MSCLNINISRVLSPPIKTKISRVGGVSAFVSMLPNMSISISSLSSRLNVAVVKSVSAFNIAMTEVSKRMEISYSIICDVSDSAYIIVEDGTIQLDYKGNPISVAVKSNTSWTIDYEQWEEGELTVSYVGNGNGVATFSSDTNEGIDRETIATFNAGEASAQLGVIQIGMREVFADFNVKEGTFNVLKHGNTKFSKEQ